MKTSFVVTSLFTGVIVFAACGKKAKDDRTNTPQPRPTPGLTETCAALENSGFVKSLAASSYVKLVWTEGPVVTPAENRATVLFAPADTCVEDNTLYDVAELKPFMSIHGHGAPTNRLQIKKLDASFSVTGLYFIMSGPWEVNVSFTFNGLRDEIEFKVNVP